MASLHRRVTFLTVLMLTTIVHGAGGVRRSSPSSLPDRAGAPRSSVRAAAQVHRVDRADMTFNMTPMRDGTIEVEAHGGDLVVRKRVRQNGSYTLTLQTPRDRVTIAFEEHTIAVTRDKKAAVLTLATASDEELDKIHRMLADSRAVRLMRVAAANIQDSEDDSPEASSLLMADAVLGVLTGDGAAPLRVARHLTRHVRASLRPIGMQIDCYAIWEKRVLTVYYQATACENSFSVWNPVRYLCATQWLLQVESYWFSFLSCSGVPQV